jgi:hypothetical protein
VSCNEGEVVRIRRSRIRVKDKPSKVVCKGDLTCVVCCCESELGNRSTSHPSPNRGGPTLHRLRLRLRLSRSCLDIEVKLACSMTLAHYVLYCFRTGNTPIISQLFQMFLQHCVWLYLGVLCVLRTWLIETVTASAK